jgi:hypothetical protein
MRTLQAMIVAIGLAACGHATPKVTEPASKSAPVTAPAGPGMQPVPASGPAVVSKAVVGHGWVKEPGTGQWIWSNEAGDNSTTMLGTEPGARGILVMNLPEGATHAGLIWVYVSYAAPGEGTWSLYTAGQNGEPVGKPAWSADVSITGKDVSPVGKGPIYTKATELDFGDAATDLTGPFYLVFETRSGHPAVGAIDGASNVRYQPKGAPAKAVPYRAFMRVVVGDVR